MPRPRFENVEPVRKEKLLRAAMTEFAAHGFEGASINRILDAAGFSKGSFYYYFDDKTDLAATVFLFAGMPERMMGELRSGVPDTVEEFWAELRRMSHDSLTRMSAHRVEYECLMRLGNAMAKDPVLTAKVMPAFAPGRLRIMDFMQRGVALGAVRTDVPMHTILALIESAKIAAHKSMFPGDVVPGEAELESFTDFVLDLARRIAAPKKKE